MRPMMVCAAGALWLAACAHEHATSEYMGTGSMDQEQVTQLLNQHGFVDISNLHKNGPDWVGSASKDGQAVSFDIDKRGTIHTK
jgi:hypothetical protein